LTESIDDAFALKVLHNVVVALEQLHYRGVAHQDVKPSNILVFEEIAKVADLGCASRRGVQSPRDNVECAGALEYAPPELLYGFVNPDWTPRRLACDVYLFGSLVMFMFSGVSATAALFSRLDEPFRPGSWQGNYGDLLPVLSLSFGSVLDAFERSISEQSLAAGLREVVEQLCHPDPDRRGHPLNQGHPETRYSLRRYGNKFDILARKAEIKLRR